MEGETLAADVLFVGGDHPMVQFTVVNDTNRPACYLVISPHQAQNWCPDDLGETEIVRAGGAHTFKPPASQSDLPALDCDLERVAQAYGLDLSRDTRFRLSEAR